MKKNIITGVASVIIIASAISIFMYINQKPPIELAGTDFIATYHDTENAILIDVRTPAEFAAGHIASAVNLDFQSPTFATDIQKLDKNASYFLYCRSGVRSGNALKSMNSMGYMNTHELQGGIVGNENTITLITDSLSAQ